MTDPEKSFPLEREFLEKIQQLADEASKYADEKS